MTTTNPTAKERAEEMASGGNERMSTEKKCQKRRFRVGKPERYEGDRFTPIEEGWKINGKLIWQPIAHTRNDKGNRNAKMIVSALATKEIYEKERCHKGIK